MNAERHVSPESLLDLAEGLPVDAALRGHVQRCADCSGRLEELRAALVSAREAPVEEPDPAYWESFLPRLRARIRREERAAGTRRAAGLAAAAAVAALALVAVSVRMREGVPAPGAAPSPAAITLLPPVADDEDFELLMDLVELADSDLDWDELDPLLGSPLDVSSLDAEEREALFERLSRALEENPDDHS